MNKTDKERLTRITEQIESFIDEIEEIQNKEAGKHYDLPEDKKQSIAGRTLENNCWLLQPFYDKLEEALSKYEVIQDLIDPSEDDFEIACMMANDYKRMSEKKFEEYKINYVRLHKKWNDKV